jgi:chromosome segregation ATPase
MPQPDYEDDLVFPPQERLAELSKMVEKLSSENQRLLNLNAGKESEIEIELKNTEQTCYGWQRLVESLEDQNNQLKAENDKLREAINSALNFMACPDDLSELTGKCNDQAAFDVLREALNNESEGDNG